MHSKPTTEDHAWARRAQQAQFAMHQLALVSDDAKLADALESIQTYHYTLAPLSTVQLKAHAADFGCRLEVRS